MYLNINARDVRLKIRDQISTAQSEWKGAKLSEKSTVEVLQKFFKVIVKELNNSLRYLEE